MVVELEKDIPSVVVSSRPPDAEVYDQIGSLIGKTPITIGVTNSVQSYELRKPGYESKSIALTPTSPSSIEVDMGSPILEWFSLKLLLALEDWRCEARLYIQKRT